MFFSTINRNPKSYLFAVIGAEYLLRMLPRGTHDYARFIKPSELARWCRDAGLEALELKGMTYNPITDQLPPRRRLRRQLFALLRKDALSTGMDRTHAVLFDFDGTLADTAADLVARAEPPARGARPGRRCRSRSCARMPPPARAA